MPRFFNNIPSMASNRESHFVGHNPFEDYRINEVTKESEGAYALRVNENYLLTVRGHGTDSPVYQKHGYYDPELFARDDSRNHYPTTLIEKVNSKEKIDFDKKIAEFRVCPQLLR